MKLKVIYMNEKRAMALCPWHKDTNPSLEITLEGEYLGKYYCHGCGKAGKLTKPLLDRILSHKRKTKNKIVNPIDWEELNKKYTNDYFWMEDPKPRPFDARLNTLIFVDMGWDGEAFTFVTRDADNEIIGIQRRFPDGFKSMVDGSRIGLFIPQIIYRPKKVLLLTEGVSDLCTILDLGYQGIGRFNDTSGMDVIEFWIEKNKFTPEIIYIISDNDKAGIKGSIKLVELLDLPGSHVLVPPLKDIRQFKEEQGIETVKNWLKENVK